MSDRTEKPARPQGLFSHVEPEPEAEPEVPDAPAGRPGKKIAHSTRKAKPDAEKRHYRSKTESFASLDPYLPYARAGAEVNWLMKRAGTSRQATEEWLRERKVTRPIGAEAKMRERNAKVIDALGLATENRDVLHRAEVSEFRGTWGEPTYVLRTPLNYDRFVLCVHHLIEYLGMGREEVAEALGVHVMDVQRAWLVQARYLEANSPKRCDHCGEPIDPVIKTGFCSKHCERLSRRSGADRT